ncbi:MAG TPA: hypothetical protein VK557_08160 [Pyrinomonadaceae bacterium]|nr:hypothetical protein [Pyrinomonadaceae bacterium]
MRWIKVANVSLLVLLVGSAFALVVTAVSNRGAGLFRDPRSFRDSNATAPPAPWALYDRDPNHVWNRLYRSLYRRIDRNGKEYGYDEIDPLLWSGTKYLLNQPANQQAVAILDEFLATHAERKIRDPLKRAMLQRDLWAVFDWTAQVPAKSPAKSTLQIKIVQVMKRLALSPAEIAALPDTYHEAVRTTAFPATYDSNKRKQTFLPADLLDPKGPWINLSPHDSPAPAALAHTEAFGERSIFRVFIRLPDGRDATLNYLQRLAEFPQHWLPDQEPPAPRLPLRPNPRVPQFPAGTQLALVRQMVLIDSEGNLRPTNMIESIQIRVHRIVSSKLPHDFFDGRIEAVNGMDTYELKLSRPRLFSANTGGLRSVTEGEKEFTIFSSHGLDAFEQGDIAVEPLKACVNCHTAPGIYSVRSHGGDLVPSRDQNQEPYATTTLKTRRADWALLQGFWRS